MAVSKGNVMTSFASYIDNVYAEMYVHRQPVCLRHALGLLMLLCVVLALQAKPSWYCVTFKMQQEWLCVLLTAS